MRASALEFRLRMVIMIVVIALGFWAPWIEGLHIGSRMTTLEWLALEMSRLGIVPFTIATPVVIVIGSLIALGGAALRIWGTAYLGFVTVNDMRMRGGTVMADGPYRFVRNPLYLGTELMFTAMAFIMPPTGAVFSLVLLAFFMLRLILGEEAFLTAQLGEAYRAYLKAVPRIVPQLRTNIPRAHSHPRWISAVLTEINPIGVFVTLAFLSWRYDHWLMVKAILITLGISLVVRAFIPHPVGQTTPAA